MKAPRQSNNRHTRNGDDELSALYRTAPRPEPDARIDDRILQAARRAVTETPRAARPFSARWQIPASIAAVIIVAVVLAPALYQHAEPEREMAPVTTRTASPVDEAHVGSESMPRGDLAPAQTPAPPASMVPTPQQHAPTVVAPYEMRAQSRQSYSPAQGVGKPGELIAPTADEDEIDIMVKRIRKLLDEGDRDAAHREFTRLRSRHPDATIDTDLIQKLTDQ